MCQAITMRKCLLILEKKIWESKSVKLLGITIDKELKFDKHIDKVCLKVNKKINVLSRMQSFLSAKKRKAIFNSFIESQFKYCPLSCGCFAVGKTMIKSIGFMKDH